MPVEKSKYNFYICFNVYNYPCIIAAKAVK